MNVLYSTEQKGRPLGSRALLFIPYLYNGLISESVSDSPATTAVGVFGGRSVGLTEGGEIMLGLEQGRSSSWKESKVQ